MVVRKKALILICLIASASGIIAASSAGAETIVSKVELNNISIVIREVPFIASKHKLRGCTTNAKSCLIDGRLPYGSSGDLPKTSVESITANLRGRTYALPVTGLYNAWGQRGNEQLSSPQRYFGGICVNTENCVFRAVLSDGAGTFAIQWEIIAGVPRTTILTGDKDIIDLFLKKIDPSADIMD